MKWVSNSDVKIITSLLSGKLVREGGRGRLAPQSTKFYTGRLRLEVQSIPFLYTILTETVLLKKLPLSHT